MALYLEIVTPDGIAWKSDGISSVTLPTTSGEIEILAGHIPLVTILQAGEVRATMGENSEDLAIDKGYARCMGDNISILTEAAIKIDAIDVDEVEKAKERALKSLQEAKSRREIDPAEIEKLEAIARFSLAQLAAKNKNRR